MGRWGHGKIGRRGNTNYQLPTTNYQLPTTYYQCPMPKYLRLRIIYLYAVSSIKNGKRHKFRLILFTVKDFILQR